MKHEDLLNEALRYHVKHDSDEDESDFPTYFDAVKLATRWVEQEDPVVIGHLFQKGLIGWGQLARNYEYPFRRGLQDGSREFLGVKLRDILSFTHEHIAAADLRRHCHAICSSFDDLQNISCGEASQRVMDAGGGIRTHETSKRLRPSKLSDQIHFVFISSVLAKMFVVWIILSISLVSFL